MAGLGEGAQKAESQCGFAALRVQPGNNNAALRHQPVSLSSRRPRGSMSRTGAPAIWPSQSRHCRMRTTLPMHTTAGAPTPDEMMSSGARSRVVSNTAISSFVAFCTTATGSSGLRPSGNEVAADVRHVFDGHIHDNDLRALAKCLPVDGRGHEARAVVARQECDRLVHISMGKRNAGIGKPADACRDTWNDT